MSHDIALKVIDGELGKGGKAPRGRVALTAPGETFSVGAREPLKHLLVKLTLI